ncbi:TspO/MBR family protein [Lysobacter korlensis]|uniref:TspO/MBR family protein n=1 Tax=Lysobacter korlensis TaxID=553636 RepID=A0ABV6RV46_9GAMM
MSVSSRMPGRAILPETVDRLRSAAVLLVFLVASTAIVMAGTALAQEHYFGWYAEAAKAPWTVSPWVSGSVWTILHIGMSVAAWLVWRERATARVSSALSLYGTQLLLNALWRPALFSFYPALGEMALYLGAAIMMLLGITVAAALAEFRKVSRAAGLLVVPYLSWILYILSLNIALIALN